MTLPAPPTDPEILADFPARSLQADFPFARVHSAVQDPEWFCSDGRCRFDPFDAAAAGFGTCYVATHVLGAYIEKFARFERAIPRSVVDAHRLSQLLLPSPVRVADMTDRTIAGRWNLSAEIWAGDDYEGSQRWAQALSRAGFNGICYPARHDTQAILLSVAVFGKPGYQPTEMIQYNAPQPIPPELIEDAARQFGVEVLPGSPLM